jgi:hypothetical protein
VKLIEQQPCETPPQLVKASLAAVDTDQGLG